MKRARIIVLVIAVVAGAIAALLAGRSRQPAPRPAPVAKIERTDVLVAYSEAGSVRALADKDLRREIWPAAAPAHAAAPTSSALPQ
jgi:pilus assembly protein CpaB